MAHFLHVGFNFEGPITPQKMDELKSLFNNAEDWFRYAANCWILWTAESAQEWYEEIRPHLGEKGRVFICRLDITHRQGWMGKGFWDWLRKER
jgi:hypothetical protein